MHSGLGLPGIGLMRGGKRPFSPLDLFQNGLYSGFYYDFSKTDRTFQESTGQTLADDNDEVVGLALEESQWGGRTLAEIMASQPELIETTAFDPGAVWTATAAGVLQNNGIVNGKLEAEVVGSYSGAGRVYRTYAVDANTFYRLTGSVEEVATNNVPFGIEAMTTGNVTLSPTVSETANGVRSHVFNTGANTSIRVALTAVGTNEIVGDKFSLSALSLKKIPGNHALQATGAARPLRKTGGFLRFDGSDDNLLTTLNPSATAMTLAFKGVGNAANTYFMGSRVDANTQAAMLINTSGFLEGRVGSKVVSSTLDTTTLNGVGILTYDYGPSVVNVYWNGSLIKTDAPAGTPNSTIPLRIGALNNNGTAAVPLNGDLFKALAINRALTPSEVSQLTANWNA